MFEVACIVMYSAKLIGFHAYEELWSSATFARKLLCRQGAALHEHELQGLSEGDADFCSK